MDFLEGDLLDQRLARRAVSGTDVVFHLAADHGGRGYVDLHQAACATNLALDANLFRAAIETDVGKIVYASSGCVYPNLRSEDPDEVLYLAETMAGPPYDADNMYGWAKLMGEMTLSDLANERGLRTVSLRYFTVYAERGKADHAVMAMIARAFLKQDPFVVWGDGRQIRNWTYVSDIVEGTILAAERIDDGTAINLGTTERTSVLDAVKEVMAYTGHDAAIEVHPELPTGPMNRVADNRLAKELLDWDPEVPFVDGLHRTIDWYFETKNPSDVAALGSKPPSPNADVTVPLDRSASSEALAERTIGGLHRYVATQLPPPTGGGRAVDLGAGSGAFSRRLSVAGWDAEAVDRDSLAFAGDVPLHQFDLNASAWPLDASSYQLVAALEVIEHIRDPIGFLTKIAGLLDEHGLAVVTTPNMDSLASRLRFLLRGKLRQMDESGDPTHISPIFMDLLERQYLPAAHLTLEKRLLHPPAAHLAVRPSLQHASRVFGRFLPGSLMGDTKIFLLRRAAEP